MIIRRKNINKRKEIRLVHVFSLFFLFFFYTSIKTYSQDSIPEAKDLSEEKELKFQQFFFKALSQKAIGNYKKAVENLESCHQILPNNTAVFFEFSKNYFLLNNILLAKEYISRAAAQEPDNLWMLKTWVKILVKENNFKEAVEIQKRVASLDAKERPFLVRLYLQDNDIENGKRLIQALENENSLPKNLLKFKKALHKRKPKQVNQNKEVFDIESLITQFKTNKSYALLKEILEKSQDNPSQLLEYSKEGMALFPAQPYVYLVNAKTLNAKKEFKKAIEVLKNGIDFVIEKTIEANFYIEMAKSYNGLGNKIEADKYIEKYKKLKS